MNKQLSVTQWTFVLESTRQFLSLNTFFLFFKKEKLLFSDWYNSHILVFIFIILILFMEVEIRNNKITFSVFFKIFISRTLSLAILFSFCCCCCSLCDSFCFRDFKYENWIIFFRLTQNSIRLLCSHRFQFWTSKWE